tara:strand:+ start:2288 stop:2416 length:129 start_codon:yes stop_codon:yes gene_type:complete
MKTFDWRIGLLAALTTAMIFCMRHMAGESKNETEIRKIKINE